MKTNKGLFYLLKDKELVNTFEELYSLKINHNQRRELVKENYICFNKFYSFPDILNKSIKESKEKNLEGKTAYMFIKDNLKEYGAAIAKGVLSVNFSPERNVF